MGEYADEYVDSMIDSWGNDSWGHRVWREPRNIDKELAGLRIAAHNAFDPIWKNGEMSRRAAYLWLGDQLGLTVKKCHIKYMNKSQCREVMRLCTVREFGKLI